MERKFNYLEWLDYYRNEIEKIKEHSPFLATSCICSGIEYIGWLLSEDSFDTRNKSREYFDNAIKTMESLKKYEAMNLYERIRCGLAHCISTKDGVVLSSERETATGCILTINVNVLFEDFCAAVESIKKECKNPVAKEYYVFIIDETSTGTTTTFINNQ